MLPILCNRDVVLELVEISRAIFKILQFGVDWRLVDFKSHLYDPATLCGFEVGRDFKSHLQDSAL